MLQGDSCTVEAGATMSSSTVFDFPFVADADADNDARDSHRILKFGVKFT